VVGRAEAPGGKGNHDDVLVKAREEIARREANREHPGEIIQTVT